MTDYISAYTSAIRDGSVTVSRWIRIIYERIEEGRKSGLYRFDAKKADKAIKFIEAFCHHNKGRNDLIVLELWQKAAVSVIFGIMDANGIRQFREVLIVIGRKNGKSTFAHAIVAYALYLDPEYGKEILCIAPKMEQADFVYSAVWDSVQKEPELLELTKHRKSDIYVESTNSILKKIAFNAKKSDGYNPSAAICDEIASWPAAQGLRQYEVVKSAFGARAQPMLISITTSGYVNEGIFDELMKRSTRFLQGGSKETRLLPLLYMIDDPEKWNDIEELKKANPNLGISVREEYMLEEIAIASESASKKAEFLTKYCCIKQSSFQAWLPAELVEWACGDPIQLEDFRSCYCIGGIDLSKTMDLTACTAVIEKNGILYVFAQFFLPASKIEEATERDGIPYPIYAERGILTISGENAVDYRDCYAWFVHLVEDLEILPLQIGYDRWNSTYLTEDMKTYGFHMDDVNQGYNLTPVIREAEAMFRDKRICIGDNDLLKIHLLNMTLKSDAVNERCKVVKKSATEHIDGGCALLDALTVRQKWYAEIGEQLKNEG